MEKKTSALTPPYGRFLIRLTRPFPDFDFSFIKPVRRRAVELLKLEPGDRVLDVDCGPGGSFPFLVEAVEVTGDIPKGFSHPYLRSLRGSDARS